MITPKQHHRDREIDKGNNDRARGHDQAREVNFGDQVRVIDQAAAAFAERSGEELPRQHRGEDHDRVGDAIRGELGDAAKDESENNHREQRTQHRPENADDGLFVAHEHVAPGEEVKELAVTKEIAPVIPLGVPGFDDQFGGGVGHDRV